MASWADRAAALGALAVLASLSGCGLAETTVTAGATAGAAAQQAKDAAAQEDRVRKAVDSAQKTEEAARIDAERRATE